MKDPFPVVKGGHAWVYGAMLAMAVWGSVAHAQEELQSAQRQPKSMKLDANGDGLISRSEANGHKRLEKQFDRLDANQDGLLSRDERAAARSKMKAQRHGQKPVDAKAK
jgi:hypothetical protein